MNCVRLFALLAGSCCTASLLFGQLAISTHSGLIQFTSGSVYLQDKLIRKTATNLPDVKKGEELRTAEDSNAEILLTPGVFLRLGSQSSVRMDANALSNTRLTLLTGTAMIEADELLDGNAVTITVGNKPIEFLKPGLFRLSAEPASVAAIKGEALVAGSDNITVKKGKELALNDAVPQLGKFHLNKKDDLFLFSDARSADSAYATGVASHSLAGSGFSCTGSSWYLMGGVGMYSYVPCNGIFSSPFGYAFYGLDYGMMYGGPFYYVPPAA